MNAEQAREMDLAALAELTVRALGVNGDGDAAHIMRHAIAHAAIELEAVEKKIEHELPNDGSLVYLLMGIRQRLELAGEGATILESLQPKGKGASNG